MKLTVFLILLGLLRVSATTSAQVFRISLDLKNVACAEAIGAVKGQTNLDFFFSNKELDVNRKVSVSCRNASLEEVLKQILGEGYRFRLVDNTVVIRPVHTEVAQQDQMVVKGIVKDSKGNPLPGVTVTIKGTLLGVATDADGQFQITVARSKDLVFVFSFVGMETLEVPLGDKTQLDVVLKSGEEELDEVVVTGYQNIKKDRAVGNVEVIRASDLMNSPHTSVDNLLAGKIAGLASFMSSGRAGANSDIRIRGVNTLSGTTQPLWIVDGLPMQGEVPTFQGSGSELQTDILNNGIGNIPPSDIESITVLKDAAATAIYGARAANGVIVITTKRPSAGNISFTYNASFALSEAPSISLGFMNSADKVQYEKELYEEFGSDSRFSWARAGGAARILIDRDRGVLSAVQAETALERLRNTNTNWMKEIFRNSFTHTHNLTMSAGSEKIQYYASVNYQKQKGILLNDEYENFSGRISVTYKPSELFDLRAGINSTFRKNDYHDSSVDPFKYAVYANPYEKPYNEDGSLAYDNVYVTVPKKQGTEQNIIKGFNIINEIENTHKNSKYESNGMSLELNLWPLKGLRFSSKGIITRTNTNTYNIADKSTLTAYNNNWIKELLTRDPYDSEIQSFYRESASFTREYSFNNTLEYSVDLSDWFINALLGQEISSTKSNDLNVFMPEYYPEYNIVGYPDIKDVNASQLQLKKFGGRSNGEKRYSSFYFSGSVGYKERYILNFNARNDGADIIGSSNRFTPLWSVSGRWNLHKEEFFKKQSLFNELHFKGQFGYTGNINRTAYPFTVITLATVDRYKDEVIASSYTHPNPSIKWEKKREIGVSMGASMLDYRLNFAVSYYDNLVTDALSLRRLPISAGVTSIYANISDVSNRGVEITANATLVQTTDFTFGVSGNFAYNKNKVAKSYYKDLDHLTLAQSMDAINPPLVDGYGVGSVFGVKTDGIDPSNGRPNVWVNKFVGDATADKSDPGNYKVQMANRGQVWVDDDRPLYLGNTNPDMTGGFGFNFRYKRLNLSTNFIYEGGHILAKFSERLSSPGGSTPTRFAKYNVRNEHKYRWRNPGDVTNVEKYEQYLVDQIPMSSDYEKGDYLKLRNVTLSYIIPASNLNFFRWVKMMRVSAQAENLFTWTAYSGIDPELRTDFGYPVPRNYRLTFHLTF